MNIISFSEWKNSHDSSAALVVDGVLVAAAEEERFSRKKHDGRFPFQAIDFCLNRAGIDMAEVDILAFPSKPFQSGRDSEVAETDMALLRRLAAEGTVRTRKLIHKRLLDGYLRAKLPAFNWKMTADFAQGFAALRERYGCIPPLRCYDHHRAHAAASYLTSGYERAAIATIDGRGSSYSAVTWRARGQDISRLRGEPFTNSLGWFYRDCTLHLGLGVGSEGKMMGLAPYGDRTVYRRQVAAMLETSLPAWYRYLAPPTENVVGFPARLGESIIEPPYPDFAAACQDALERAVARIVEAAMKSAKSRDLCLGGGVMLNCSSNGAILASETASSVWIFPAAGDGGLSVGAALLCAAELGELRPNRLENAYWGPDFSSTNYESALHQEPRVVFERASDLPQQVARFLAAGQVAGWFQGRMELGPRALGNRSILADPRTVAMRDRVNTIKNREKWRPLAPVVLAERADEFFDLKGPSPFMLFAAQVRSEKRALIPATVHVDGSARPQTVTREQNAPLHALICAFEQHSGVPVLLNTSFNDASEPIVCTPQDAIRTFLATQLDFLILGDIIVRRREGN